MKKKRSKDIPRARFVSVTDLAAALEISPRRIQQLVTQGVLRRKVHGKYDKTGCARRYNAYLERQMSTYGYLRAAGPRSSGGIDLAIDLGALVEGKTNG